MDEFDTCSLCGAEVRGTELKALPRLDQQPDKPPRVKLVRELKMPTVGHLIEGADGSTLQLEETLQSMESAIGDGDLSGADQLLDNALAETLVGESGVDRGWIDRILPFVLWFWCGMLLLMFIASLFM